MSLETYTFTILEKDTTTGISGVKIRITTSTKPTQEQTTNSSGSVIFSGIDNSLGWGVDINVPSSLSGTYWDYNRTGNYDTWQSLYVLPPGSSGGSWSFFLYPKITNVDITLTVHGSGTLRAYYQDGTPIDFTTTQKHISVPLHSSLKYVAEPFVNNVVDKICRANEGDCQQTNIVYSTENSPTQSIDAYFLSTTPPPSTPPTTTPPPTTPPPPLYTISSNYSPTEGTYYTVDQIPNSPHLHNSTEIKQYVWCELKGCYQFTGSTTIYCDDGTFCPTPPPSTPPPSTPPPSTPPPSTPPPSTPPPTQCTSTLSSIMTSLIGKTPNSCDLLLDLNSNGIIDTGDITLMQNRSEAENCTLLSKYNSCVPITPSPTPSPVPNPCTQALLSIIGALLNKTNLNSCEKLLDLNNDGTIDILDLTAASQRSESDNCTTVNQYNSCITSENRIDVIVTQIQSTGIRIGCEEIIGCAFGVCASGPIPVSIQIIHPPVPSSKTISFREADGLVLNKRYNIYGGDLQGNFCYESDVVKFTPGLQTIYRLGTTIPPPFLRWLCDKFGVPYSDCTFAGIEFMVEFVVAIRSIKCIIDEKDFSDSPCIPTEMDYLSAGLSFIPFVGPASKGLKIGNKVYSSFGGRLYNLRNKIGTQFIDNAIATFGKEDFIRSVSGMDEPAQTKLLQLIESLDSSGVQAQLAMFLRDPATPTKSSVVKYLTQAIDDILEKAPSKSNDILSSTKILESQAKAMKDFAMDYTAEITTLRNYIKDNAMFKDVAKNYEFSKISKVWKEALPGSERIHTKGITGYDIIRTEILLKPGDFSTILPGDKAIGFISGLLDDIDADPQRFIKIFHGLTDAEVDIAANKFSLLITANEIRALKTADIVITNNEGILEGTKKVAAAITTATKASDFEANPEAAKVSKSIIDSVTDTLKPSATETVKITDLTTKIEDPALANNTYIQKLWSWFKNGLSTQAGKDWSVMTAQDKVVAWAKWAMKNTYSCFALFIAEEAMQLLVLSSIPISAAEQGWATKTAAQKTEILAYNRKYLDATWSLYYFLSVVEAPYLIICWPMGLIYIGNTAAVNIALNNLEFRYNQLSKDSDPNGGYRAFIRVKANVDGVTVFINDTVYPQTTGTYPELFEVIIREDVDSTLFVVVGSKKGYLNSTATVVLSSRDAGTRHDVNLDLAVDPDPNRDIPTDPKSINPTSETVGDVSCTSYPSGALVWYDNVNTGDVTPWTIKSIAQGSHVFKFVLADFPDCTQTINVIAKQTVKANCNFTTSVGRIVCTSNPPYATIILDGTQSGHVTPWTFENQSLGSHTVAMSLSGYSNCPSQTVNVTATSDGQASCNFTNVLGKIACSSNPPGAEIFLDGNSTSHTTPWTLDNISLGSHTIKMTLSGFSPCQDQTVNVTSTSVAQATCNFKGEVGTLDCFCVAGGGTSFGGLAYCARGADIIIDGKTTGQKTTNSPYKTTIQNLSAGTHTIEYNLYNVMKATGSVTITAGGIANFSGEIVGVLDPNQSGVLTTVTEIVDGDTIRTALTDLLPDKPMFRIVGYDAPESGTDAGTQATQKLTSLIPVGTSITLKIDQYEPLDKYNRVLGGIFVGGTDIAVEMLKSCLVDYLAGSKVYWVDWAVYKSKHCPRPTGTTPPPGTEGGLTLTIYDSRKILLTGCQVTVDNIDKGSATGGLITVKNLSPGQHTVKVIKSGFTTCSTCPGDMCTPAAPVSPCSFSVTVVSKQTVTYEVNMLKTFSAQIVSFPAGAQITVDGNVITSTAMFLGMNRGIGNRTGIQTSEQALSNLIEKFKKIRSKRTPIDITAKRFDSV